MAVVKTGAPLAAAVAASSSLAVRIASVDSTERWDESDVGAATSLAVVVTVVVVVEGGVEMGADVNVDEGGVEAALEEEAGAGIDGGVSRGATSAMTFGSYCDRRSANCFSFSLRCVTSSLVVFSSE